MNRITIYEFRKSIMLGQKCVFLAASIAVFYWVYWHYYYEATYFYKGNYVFLLLYSVIYFIFLQTYGALRIGRVRVGDLVFSNVLALTLTNGIAYFVMSLIARAMLNPIPTLVSVGVQGIVGYAFFAAGARLYRRLYPPVATLLVTAGAPHDAEMAVKFQKARSQYDICAKVSMEEGLAAVQAQIDGYHAVVLGSIDAAQRARLVGYCFEKRKQFFILPNMQDIILNNAAQFLVGDGIAYQCESVSFRPDQLAVKRLMDIGVSLIGLIVTSPVLLLTALAIKLYDGGDVFYKQTRLTRNGKEFQLIKFRSMVMDAEKKTGAVLASQKDSRITPIGKIIRATRIDELPQFLNILKGDMSLVGPRPERPEMFREICKDFPQFSYRLKVKAGLTGYAQLYGRYNTAFEDKVRLDLLYIQRASLLLDLQLLFYTVKILFMKESTEGVEDKAKGASLTQTDYEDAKSVTDG